MSSQTEHKLHDVQETLTGLNISTPTPVVPLADPNPWQDARSDILQEPLKPTATTLDVADLSSLDPVAKGLAAEGAEDEEPEAADTRQGILEEFDPLASHEEQAAKEAWESSHSQPPPPQQTSTDLQVETQTQQPLVKPAEDTAEQSRLAAGLSSFPTLAALARTFALPLSSRQRPRSLDTAASVPSPATLSSFASQQDMPRPGASSAPDSGRSTPNRASRSTPAEPPTFDFQKFLDQMKTRSAEPVAKYLRSFLSNFAKRTFTVNDQVKLINDFLNFISTRMRETDLWRDASDAEFENAMEGMEKLVMNRLYDFTFTPQAARVIPPRPVTADDLERDRVLSQRIALFKWIEPKHLDISEENGSEGFMMFAQQELLKINHYKAPRDKLICILNCCKVIFGLLRHLRKEEGADGFIPVLIYVVLKANPEHLLSNVEFINRFRNPAKLQSEAGYYLSSLMGAVSFIETMDHTSLSNITQEEFENNVEAAIRSLPCTANPSPNPGTPVQESPISMSIPSPSSHTGEESAQPLTLPAPTQSLSEDAKRLLQKTGDTISKPLSAIGRIFNEVLDGAEESLASFAELGKEPQAPQGYVQRSPGEPSAQPPYQPRIRRTPSPASAHGPHDWGHPAPEGDGMARPWPETPHTRQPLALGPSQPIGRLQPTRVQSLVQQERALHAPGASPHVSRTPTPSLDFAGMQAEIDRVHEHASVAAKETLKQIFPTMDVEIMELVLEANDGDLGKSIESLLEMSGST